MTKYRSYIKTHPWITFAGNLSKAGPDIWLLLGECQSKCDHISHVPLRPSTSEELHRIYLAKGAQATVAIEGNTLSEAEVRNLIDGKLEVPESKEYLKKEADNIIEACNEMKLEVDEDGALMLNADRLKDLNRQVLKGLDLPSHVVPGQFTETQLGVGNIYRAVPPEDCPYLVDRLCEWLNGEEFLPPQKMQQHAYSFAILKAVLAHLYLAWIHPFGDGNGRTARLVEFQILITSGIPAPAAQLLSNHYNATRSEYYRQLNEASKSGGEIIPFIEYAVQGYLDGLKEQLQYIYGQLYDVTWRNYVYERFREMSGVANERRRHLILDLSRQNKVIPKSKLSMLTPRLAAAYAKKTAVTLTRDLNELQKMGLISKTSEGYVARSYLIHAFRPTQAVPDHEVQADTNNP